MSDGEARGASRGVTRLAPDVPVGEADLAVLVGEAMSTARAASKPSVSVKSMPSSSSANGNPYKGAGKGEKRIGMPFP